MAIWALFKFASAEFCHSEAIPIRWRVSISRPIALGIFCRAHRLAQQRCASSLTSGVGPQNPNHASSGECPRSCRASRQSGDRQCRSGLSVANNLPGSLLVHSPRASLRRSVNKFSISASLAFGYCQRNPSHAISHDISCDSRATINRSSPAIRRYRLICSSRCCLGIHNFSYYNLNSLSVTAPSDAVATCAAYFASTPRV